jgi:hypothetical protein
MLFVYPERSEGALPRQMRSFITVMLMQLQTVGVYPFFAHRVFAIGLPRFARDGASV